MIEREFARLRRRLDPKWSIVWHHHRDDMHLVLMGLIAEALR